MPGGYYGDFPASHTAVCLPFDSFAASTGASSATSNFAAGDIQIYKDGGVTQRSSSSGIVVTTSFDSNTGLQMVTIDLSDNTDAGFYAAGHEYQVAVADVTIDSQTVRFWLGSFSIERAGGMMTATQRNAIADALLNRDMSVGTDSGSPTFRTPRQAWRLQRNKWSISGTTLTITKEDDSTASWTTVLTSAAGADPISGSDPAGP